MVLAEHPCKALARQNTPAAQSRGRLISHKLKCLCQPRSCNAWPYLPAQRYLLVVSKLEVFALLFASRAFSKLRLLLPPGALYCGGLLSAASQVTLPPLERYCPVLPTQLASCRARLTSKMLVFHVQLHTCRYT